MYFFYQVVENELGLLNRRKNIEIYNRKECSNEKYVLQKEEIPSWETIIVFAFIVGV